MSENSEYDDYDSRTDAGAGTGQTGFVGPVWRMIRNGVTNIGSLPRLVRESVTYRLFVVMVAAYIAQVVITVGWGNHTSELLFLLSEDHPWRIWTWVTHVFAHGNLFHLAVNMVVLISFGSIVEDRLGGRRYLVFFLITGVLSGLGQTVAEVVVGSSLPGLVGASGALSACVGYLTMDSPNIRVLMFFLIPVSLWRASVVFAALSGMAILTGGIGYFNIAHVAHLTGLGIGVIYGIIRAGREEELSTGGSHD